MRRSWSSSGHRLRWRHPRPWPWRQRPRCRSPAGIRSETTRIQASAGQSTHRPGSVPSVCSQWFPVRRSPRSPGRPATGPHASACGAWRWRWRRPFTRESVRPAAARPASANNLPICGSISWHPSFLNSRTLAPPKALRYSVVAQSSPKVAGHRTGKIGLRPRRPGN